MLQQSKNLKAKIINTYNKPIEMINVRNSFPKTAMIYAIKQQIIMASLVQ